MGIWCPVQPCRSCKSYPEIESSFAIVCYICGTRDKAVGIVTRLRARGEGVRIPAVTRELFFIPKYPHRPWDPHILLFSAWGGGFLWAKSPRSAVDRSPPAFGKVKNECSRASTALMTHWRVEGQQFFPVTHQPKRADVASLVRLLDHTETHNTG
jgi:hypothetical protein